MDDQEEEDNQEMQAMLGFSAFGATQDRKKKQFIVSDGSQSPAKRLKLDVEVREKDNSDNQAAIPESNQQPESTNTRQNQTAEEAEWEAQQAVKFNYTTPTHPDYQPTLKQWAKGVQMPGGDTAYFLPEFVDEDPWKHLRKG